MVIPAGPAIEFENNKGRERFTLHYIKRLECLYFFSTSTFANEYFLTHFFNTSVDVPAHLKGGGRDADWKGTEVGREGR